MVEGFRLYFLVYYGLGIVVALITVATDYLRSAPVGQRPEGAGRHLLPLLVLVMLLLPPSLIFVRAGEIEAEWVPVRILGVAMSLYTAGMELWVATALGRFLVARAVVFQDHALITQGPYRFLRHPDYSPPGALAGCRPGKPERLAGHALPALRHRFVGGGALGGTPAGVEVRGDVQSLCVRQAALRPPAGGPSPVRQTASAPSSRSGSAPGSTSTSTGTYADS